MLDTTFRTASQEPETTPYEPEKVELTEDYLDLNNGIGYPAGTVLVRSQHGTGQYMLETTKLGGECISHFSL